MAAPEPPRTSRSKCQWIAGEPTADDSCKCGETALVGKPYCEAHWNRSFTKRVYQGKAGDVPLWMVR